MDPVVTTSGIDASPATVIGAVAVGVVIALAAVGIRRFLIAYADELADLWRQYSPIAANRMLDRRSSMPSTPWYCDRCRSYNARATGHCYACGARRAEAEAPVPDADTPAGPSAGRSQRTRRSG